jgi:serine/threonine protein kinase
MELRVGNKFKLVKKLGTGAFGELYAGVNIKTGEEVAVKLELIYMEKPQL